MTNKTMNVGVLWCLAAAIGGACAMSKEEGPATPGFFFEKTLLVTNGICKVEVDFGEPSSNLRIRLTSVVTNHAGVVAEDTSTAILHAINPETNDFAVAMSPDKSVLWLLVRERLPFVPTPPDVPLLLHAMVKQDSLDGQRFVHYVIKRKTSTDGGLKEAEVKRSLSLNLQLAMRHSRQERVRRGQPLGLGDKALVSDVRLECIGTNTVVVTGCLGGRYSFKSTIDLVKDRGLVPRGMPTEFVFTPLKDDKAIEKAPPPK